MSQISCIISFNPCNSARDESWLNHLISFTLKAAGSPLNHHQVCGKLLNLNASPRVLNPSQMPAMEIVIPI